MNIFYRSEPILVTFSVYDKDNNAVAYSTLTEIEVKVTDKQGTSYTYKKTTGQVSQGTSSNSYKFEISSTQTTAFAAGKLKARFKYQMTSADFPNSSNTLTDIIEEGVVSDFIILQD